MTKKLTVLIVSLDAYGHVYPCLGVGQQLLQKGHRVVVAIDKSWEGKIVKYGLEEELFCLPKHEQKNKASEDITKKLLEKGFMEDKTPLEKMNITQMLDKMKKTEPFIEDIIKKVNPDVIVVDMIMICPVILKSNKPWINLMPANPLGILLTKNLPPSNFGLPTNDNSEWEICRKEVEKFSNEYFQYIKEWFNAYNIEPPYSKESWFGCSSPYLNLYAFPEELDYTDTLIVSKEIFGEEYELSDNCWGKNHIPQTKILEIVDLAIIHGGNNSFCESFHFGKPMIVMPLFGDHYDDAQRVHEKGFGIRIDPFE